MTLTARQLIRNVRRGMNRRDKDMVEDNAMEWAGRVERGPVRSCVPKKKQRQAGLIPPAP